MKFSRLHLPILSVLILCAAIIFAFAPGHMDADAIGWLRWIRTGKYTDWYSLFTPALLKASTALGVGPTGILACQVLMIGLSTYAILAFFSTPLIAAVACYCVLLCPAVLGYLGAITSHAIVTAFLLCGFAALLYLSRPGQRKSRIVLFIISFVALSAANVARITAVLFVLPGFCVWVLFLMRDFQLPQWKPMVRTLAVTITASVITLTTTLVGNAFFSALFHPIHAGTVQGLAYYDIVAISLRANKLFIDSRHFPDQRLDQLRKIFVENNPDPLLFRGDPKGRIQIIFSDDQSEVWREWRGCIAMYPGYYVTERWHLLRGLLGLDFRVPPAVPYHPGIDSNDLGYHIANPTEDAIVVHYLAAFQKTIVDRPFIYVVLLFVAIFLFFWRHVIESGARLVLLVLSFGNVLYVGSQFVATPSTLLRYLWPSIVISMVALAAAVVAHLAFALRHNVRVKSLSQASRL